MKRHKTARLRSNKKTRREIRVAIMRAVPAPTQDQEDHFTLDSSPSHSTENAEVQYIGIQVNAVWGCESKRSINHRHLPLARRHIHQLDVWGVMHQHVEAPGLRAHSIRILLRVLTSLSDGTLTN